ncbi:DUF2079 domain-containing protein [Chloroflexota bacterium]
MPRIGRLLAKLKDRPLYIVLILIAVYTLYASACAIFRYYGLYYGAFDMGIYMQTLWTTLHTDEFLYTSLWEGSRFATHFEPVLFTIMPLYALLPYAATLLVLQSFIMALGALPVYLIAREELGERAGVAFAGLYLLYPALHGINQDEFHGSALAIPFLLFCFYMFKNKRYIWGMVFAVLAMMIRENVPLVVIFMGLYWLWEERDKIIICLKERVFPRERSIIFPASLVITGTVWLGLAMLVIIPSFNPEGAHPLINDYSTPFQNLIVDPNVKTFYIFSLFMPLLFTSLLHPSALLIAFPIFAQNLLIDNVGMYHIWTQHPSLLIPGMFIASIYGVKKLPDIKNRFVRRIYLRGFLSGRLLHYMVGISLSFTLIMGFVFGPLAGRGINLITLPRDIPQMVSHHQTLQQAIDLIDGPVYSQDSLFTFLCHRLDVYHTIGDTDFFEGYRRIYPGEITPWSDEVKERGFDYILMDETEHTPIMGYEPDRAYMMNVIDEESKLRIENEYGVYAEGDGIYLYKKGYEGEPVFLD